MWRVFRSLLLLIVVCIPIVSILQVVDIKRPEHLVEVSQSLGQQYVEYTVRGESAYIFELDASRGDFLMFMSKLSFTMPCKSHDVVEYTHLSPFNLLLPDNVLDEITKGKIYFYDQFDQPQVVLFSLSNPELEFSLREFDMSFNIHIDHTVLRTMKENQIRVPNLLYSPKISLIRENLADCPESPRSGSN